MTLRAKLAPLARDGEHGAENLEGAVGRAAGFLLGLVRRGEREQANRRSAFRHATHALHGRAWYPDSSRA